MSTKGIKTTTTTKRAISQAKTKITVASLIQSHNKYIETLTTDPKLLPNIAGFALFTQVNRQYLLELAQSHPEVANMIEDIGTRQEQYLLQNGITNTANSSIAIFILKAKHNFKEQNNNLTQNNNFNISTDVLKQALLEMAKNDST